MPTLDTAYDTTVVSQIPVFTNGVLGTASDTTVVESMIFRVDLVDITAVNTVTVAVETYDMLAARAILAPSGSMSIDLSSATLESGEPNTEGFTKTVWLELPLNPNTVLSGRVTLASSTSVGKVAIYKQPSLDDFLDFQDLEEDDMDEADPTSSEPKFAEFVKVQAGSADQVFDLDQEYGSSYFLQVGLLSGTGNDFILSWGDAAPGLGGMFENPVEITGAGGAISVSSQNAWIQASEPNTAGIVETRSVWIRWTAPAGITGGLNFTVTPGLKSPYAVEIYTGSAINALTLVSSNLNSAGTATTVSLSAPTVGSQYWIRIAATVDASFSITWSKSRVEYPAAEPVQSVFVTVHAGATGATLAGLTYAPNALITELPNRVGVQFQETLNVPGSGSVTVRQDDAVVRAFNPEDWPTLTGGPWATTGGTDAGMTQTPTQSTWSKDPFQLLQFGNIVKFWMLNSGLGQMKCVSAFIIKSRETNIVGSGEESDRVITISGPTVSQFLADFYVVHDNYPSTRGTEMRTYSWASVVGAGDKWTEGGWFDSTGTYLTNKRSWNNPINQSEFKKPPGYRKKRGESYSSRPKYALTKLKSGKWPDLHSRWMWMEASRSYNQDKNFPPTGKSASTYHYYKSKSFNITTGGARYRFSVYSDTYYRIYVDGVLFFSGNGNESYTKWTKKNITLSTSSPTNTHNVSVYVEDRKSSGKDYDHNDAFLLTVQQLNSKGKVVKTILRSNESSWYAWHGQNPPAWSNAMIMASVIREAQQRGNHSAKILQMRTDFGQVSEEGSAWYDEKQRSVNLQVGTSALDLQQQLSETNRFDFDVDPDTLAVRAWQGGGTNGGYPRGDDKSNSVALTPGYNLLNWTVTETDEVKNKLLVQYGEGSYVYVNADTDSGQYESIEKYGAREGYLELGGITDQTTAIDNAKSILTYVGSADSVSGSSDIVGHFSETYNGSVIPVRGAVPFLDWGVGDTVSAPASNSMLRPHRVLSITCTEDEDGNLTFDPELQGV